MKKVFTIITAALGALLLCSSCGKFIEEDNAICKYPWQLDSLVTYNNLTFQQLEARYYGPESEILEFVNVGSWTYLSNVHGDYEYGSWQTEVIPVAGASFRVNFFSYNPGYFIDPQHNEEDYAVSISSDGLNMNIVHQHTDSTTFQVYFFTQINMDEKMKDLD